MNNIIYDDLDNLISEIIASTDFLRLKELKKIIDEKYKKEIWTFKRAESIYNDALPNKNYYKDFDKISLNLSNAKNVLYSMPEVIEYKILEEKINEMLISLSNDIANIMSNKFKKKKIIG